MSFYISAYRAPASKSLPAVDCKIDCYFERFFRSEDMDLIRRLEKLYYAKGGKANSFAVHAVRVEQADLAQLAAEPTSDDRRSFVDNASRILADGQAVIVHSWW
jgi:hypothetical protein